MNTDTIPGEWIKAAVREAGVDQKELARLLSWDHGTVNRKANGRGSSVRRHEWMAILAALELPRGWEPLDD